MTPRVVFNADGAGDVSGYKVDVVLAFIWADDGVLRSFTVEGDEAECLWVLRFELLDVAAALFVVVVLARPTEFLLAHVALSSVSRVVSDVPNDSALLAFL